MREVSGFAQEAIAQILQWSAEAQVSRRKAGANSPAFYTLTGTVAAYAKVLALLTALQRVEAFSATCERSDVGATDAHEREIRERDVCACTDEISNYKGRSHYVAEKLSRLWSTLS